MGGRRRRGRWDASGRHSGTRASEEPTSCACLWDPPPHALLQDPPPSCSLSESAFIPFVSFGDLDNNTFKGLTSLLSVEQEIQYDEHT
jgi:hypothetical protein